MPWGTSNSTEVGTTSGTGGQGGQRPKANEWHHAVMVYSGSNPRPMVNGIKGRNMQLYLDGRYNLEKVLGNDINILRQANMVIGQYVSTAGAAQVATNGLTIGQIRLHDGVLYPDDVQYNYAIDAAFYRGFKANFTGIQPIIAPSATPSPSAGAAPTPAACPTAWGQSPTHYLRLISLQSAADETAYARHCGYWLFMLPNFPVTDATASADASQVCFICLMLSICLSIAAIVASVMYMLREIHRQLVMPSGDL